MLNRSPSAELRSQLLAGAASAPTTSADESYFDGLREQVRHAGCRAGKKRSKA